MKASGVAALSAAICVEIAGSPALAETLPISGVYPARTDGAVGARVIALESFGGDQGAEVNFSLNDALESVRIDGENWFVIVPTSGDDVDAVLRGSASSDVSYRRVDDKKKTKCEEKDDNGKCIRRRVTYVQCREMIVELRPSIRLIAVDGTELYGERDMIGEKRHYCAEGYEPSSRAILEKLVSDFTRQVRYDLAPVQRSQGIRVMESRKNLNKKDRKPFRNAVKLTKTDVSAACSAFAALEANNPQHPSVLYNIGLCAEGLDDFEKAADYYNRALAVEPGKDYPTRGLQRISDRARADMQLEEHFGPVESEADIEADTAN